MNGRRKGRKMFDTQHESKGLGPAIIGYGKVTGLPGLPVEQVVDEVTVMGSGQRHFLPRNENKIVSS